MKLEQTKRTSAERINEGTKETADKQTNGLKLKNNWLKTLLKISSHSIFLANKIDPTNSVVHVGFGSSEILDFCENRSKSECFYNKGGFCKYVWKFEYLSKHPVCFESTYAGVLKISV